MATKKKKNGPLPGWVYALAATVILGGVGVLTYFLSETVTNTGSAEDGNPDGEVDSDGFGLGDVVEQLSPYDELMDILDWVGDQWDQFTEEGA